MPDEKKGITVKVDAVLHAQVREYIESHGMTMNDFVAQALDNELHPKIQEGQGMNNTRTMAFQVPEDLFLQIKDYLNRHHLTQKDFVIGLIKAELYRDQQAIAEETQDESEVIDETIDDELTEETEYANDFEEDDEPEDTESEDEEYDAETEFGDDYDELEEMTMNMG